MTIDEQKEIADYILKGIEKFDPTCILAGGAVRDWYYGRLAEDLDIFFHFRKNSKLKYVKKLLNNSFPQGDFIPTPVGFKSHVSEHYEKNPGILRVWEGTYGGQKIQLIEMNSPTFHGVVDQFPLTICKAWYKNGKCVYEREFLNAHKMGVIVKTNNLYADKDKFIGKIRNKFPDMKYYESYEDVHKYHTIP